MKKYTLLFIALLIYTVSQAAEADTTRPQTKKPKHAKPSKPPVCYLGISTGINNAPGIAGIDFNIAISKFATLDAGVGPSTWGNKIYVGAKYYLKEAHRNWAVGGGLTYSSGQENEKFTLNTQYGGYKEKVAISLQPIDNAFVAIYHYWTLGKKYNRFFVDLGKSIELHQPHIHEVSGYGSPPLSTFTDQSVQRVKNRAPGSNALGGIMLGVGVSFGLYRK